MCFWAIFEGTKIENLSFLRVGDFGDKNQSLGEISSNRVGNTAQT